MLGSPRTARILRRTVAIDPAVMLCVVLVTAFLVALPTEG
jgi:hypothetical protein